MIMKVLIVTQFGKFNTISESFLKDSMQCKLRTLTLLLWILLI